MAWLTVPMRGTTCHSTVSGIGDAQALGFGVNKLLATFFGAVAGALGSLFLPSLSLGAELGPSRHLLPPQLPLAQVVAPLMRAVFIGIPCSRLVHLEGIYHALSHRFVAQARR